MKDDYSKDDTVETLSREQLELIARTDSDILLRVLADTTIFDVHRVRLMLDLGVVKAKRRLDAMTSNKEVGNEH